MGDRLASSPAGNGSTPRRLDGEAQIDALFGPDHLWIERCRDAVRGGSLAALDALEAEADRFDSRLVVGGRAMSAVARAIVQPDSAEERLSEARAVWLSSHLIGPSGDAPVPARLVEQAPTEGAERVLRQLVADRSPGGAFLALVVLELDGVSLPRSRPVETSVLFSRNTLGETATLAFTRIEHGPPGIHPDPLTASFLEIDEDLRQALHRAWDDERWHDRSVLWSLYRVRPRLERVRGSSLGLAARVGLDELDRSLRRGGRWRLKRLDPGCAVTGSLGPAQTVQGIDHLEPKLTAAKKAGLRVVAPEENRGEGEALKLTTKVAAIDYAATVEEAIDATRTRWHPASVAALVGAVSTVLVTLLVASLVFNWQRHEREQADRRALVADLVNQAGVVEGSDPQLSLLLALESYRLSPTERSADYLFQRLSHDPNLIGSLDPEGAILEDGIYLAGGRSLVTADSEGGVRTWDMRRRRPVSDVLTNHRVPVLSLAPQPGAPAFASGDAQGEVRLWDTSDLRHPTSDVLQEAAEVAVADVGFSFDGTQIGALREDGLLTVFSTTTNDQLYSIDVNEAMHDVGGVRPTGDASSLQFTLDGSPLVAVGSDLALLDLTHRQVDVVHVGRVAGGFQGRRITTLAPQPSAESNTTHYLVGTEAGLYVWRQGSRRARAIPEVSGEIRDIEIGFSSTVVATDSGTYVLGNSYEVEQVLGSETSGLAASFETGRPVVTFPPNETLLWDDQGRGLRDDPLYHESLALQYLDDGDLLVGSVDGYIYRVDAQANENNYYDEQVVVEGNSTRGAWIRDLALDGQGHLVFTHDDPARAITVVDLDDGREVSTPAISAAHASGQGGRAVAFVDGGRRMVTVDFDGHVYLWDTTTWEQIADAVVSGSRIQALAVSPDGATIAIGTIGTFDDMRAPGRLVLLDARDLRARGNGFEVHRTGVTSLAYAPVGRLYVGTLGGALVQLESGGDSLEEVHDFRGTDGSINQIRLSPDGGQLAVATSTSVQLLDVATNEPAGLPLTAPGIDPFALAFSPDGSRLAVSNVVGEESDGTDGTGAVVDRWRLDRATWEDTACRRAGRDLTDEEWQRYVGNSVEQVNFCRQALDAQARDFARLAAAEDVVNPTDLDATLHPVSEEEAVDLPVDSGQCRDLRAARVDTFRCQVFGAHHDRAWAADLVDNDDGYTSRGTLTLYRRRGGAWHPTLEAADLDFVVEVTGESFAPWQDDLVMITVAYDGSGSQMDHVVTDGEETLYHGTSERGGDERPEGPNIRTLDPAYAGFEPACCPSGWSTGLVRAGENGWAPGPRHATVRREVAQPEDAPVLRPDGFDDIEFGAPMGDAIATVGRLVRDWDDVPLDPVADTVQDDGIASQPGEVWPMAPVQVLHELCWSVGLCLYGQSEADGTEVFVGWTYSVPREEWTDPGAATPTVRFRSADGLYLGASFDALQDELGAEQRPFSGDDGGDPPVQVLSVDAWPDGSAFTTGPNGLVWGIVAGLHRPLTPHPSVEPPVGRILSAGLPLPGWPGLAGGPTFGDGTAPRFTAVTVTTDPITTGVASWTIAEDTPNGQDRLRLAAVHALPLAPAGFYYDMNDCRIDEYATAGLIIDLRRLDDTGADRPTRSWVVQADGTLAPVPPGDPNPACGDDL